MRRYTVYPYGSLAIPARFDTWDEAAKYAIDLHQPGTLIYDEISHLTWKCHGSFFSL